MVLKTLIAAITAQLLLSYTNQQTLVVVESHGFVSYEPVSVAVKYQLPNVDLFNCTLDKLVTIQYIELVVCLVD